uniref:Uncharacterized protein n=1 Tax=uncultured marine virus TaxID=186617 RepID=A0A0F7L804_9VIRU|nr:hypothetical protein [uncultured marine virus]
MLLLYIRCHRRLSPMELSLLYLLLIFVKRNLVQNSFIISFNLFRPVYLL